MEQIQGSPTFKCYEPLDRLQEYAHAKRQQEYAVEEGTQ